MWHDAAFEASLINQFSSSSSFPGIRWVVGRMMLATAINYALEADENRLSVIARAEAILVITQKCYLFSRFHDIETCWSD